MDRCIHLSGFAILFVPEKLTPGLMVQKECNGIFIKEVLEKNKGISLPTCSVMFINPVVCVLFAGAL